MGTIWDYSINNSHCISRDFLPNAMFGSRPQRSKEKTAALRHAFLKRWRRQRKTSSNWPNNISGTGIQLFTIQYIMSWYIVIYIYIFMYIYIYISLSLLYAYQWYTPFWCGTHCYVAAIPGSLIDPRKTRLARRERELIASVGGALQKVDSKALRPMQRHHERYFCIWLHYAPTRLHTLSD